MSRSVYVCLPVHLVVADAAGARCCAAMVTAVPGPTDAYRELDTLGLRAWPDTGGEIVLPLSGEDGGVPHHPGWVSKTPVPTCTGLGYPVGTWHHPPTTHQVAW